MGLLRYKRRPLAVAAAFALLASLTVAAGPAAAGDEASCAGGPILPGTYQTLTITGTCVVIPGALTVLDGLTVAPGATLIALDPAATVTISGGLRVGDGAVLLFGCAPSLPSELCSGTTDYVISGDVVATNALAVIMHGNMIHGDVTVARGGGGVNCGNVLFGGEAPAWTTFEGNIIHGTLVVTGLQTCWFGVARDQIAGSVVLAGNVQADPDSNEVIDNTIGGALVCVRDAPLPHNDGQSNTVAGPEIGQCAGL